jgi:hypothetical protein
MDEKFCSAIHAWSIPEYLEHLGPQETIMSKDHHIDCQAASYKSRLLVRLEAQSTSSYRLPKSKLPNSHVRT